LSKFVLSGYRKLSLLALVSALAFLISGCSVSSLSEKIFGKSNAEAKLPAEFVHIDQQAVDAAITSMIRDAKKSIWVEQYELDRKDLLDLLVSKAKQGVEVKVLLDQSPKSAKATYDYLKGNSVGVQYYPTQKGQFDKVKLLAIDSSRALIAGNDWATSASINHDAALELNGKSAWKTAWVFARDWKFATTIDLNLAETSLPDDNVLLSTNANIQSQVTTQMQGVKNSIQIELNQFTFPAELINLLADAAAGGKKVQVILDSAQQKTNQSTIDKLKSSGAQVRQYPADDKHKLAAHFALFDDRVTILGSANWTRSSFVQNHELAVTVPSKAITAKLAAVFNADWEKSKEVEKPAPKPTK